MTPAASAAIQLAFSESSGTRRAINVRGRTKSSPHASGISSREMSKIPAAVLICQLIHSVSPVPSVYQCAFVPAAP